MILREQLVNWLQERGVPFRTMEHEPTRTSEDSARVRGEALSKGAKAILMKVDQQMVLLVFPADRRVQSSKLKQLLKADGMRAKKLRFATAEELFDLTGLVPGSVPPFGRPVLPFPLYVDASLLDQEEIAFNAGELTFSVFMQTADYIRVSHARTGTFTVAPNPGT